MWKALGKKMAGVHITITLPAITPPIAALFLECLERHYDIEIETDEGASTDNA